MSDLSKVKEMEKKGTGDVSKVLRKKINVGIDFSVDDVLLLDKEGSVLIFEDEPDQFLKMGDSYKKLGEPNRVSYLCALSAYNKHKKSFERDALPSDVQIYGQAAMATDLLYIGNKDPNFEYSWKRTDELPIAMRQGWGKVPIGGREEFFNKLGTVGKAGYTEYTAMRTPKENYQKILDIASEKSNRRRGKQAAEEGAAEIAKAGGKPKVLDNK